MLTHLFVTNYTLIDELSLDFSSGLTILTGETGAGKSILLGALKLVLGERADLQAIKNQEQKCIIEAHFDIKKLNLKSFFEENDLDYEDISILRREILPSGKTRAFVNDVPVRLNILNKLSGALIDIHSQFQTADLLKDAFQFEWIDAVAQQQEELRVFRKDFHLFKEKQAELKKLTVKKAEFQQEYDYNSFLFEELEAANLEDVSLEELEREQFALENAEEIALNLSEMLQTLENEDYGILTTLNAIVSKSKGLSEFLESSQLDERIEALRIESIDITQELNTKLESVEINPERLMEVQQRLNELNKLLQKHYVQEIEDLINIKKELSEKLSDTLQIEESISRLEKEVSKLKINLASKADELSQQRKKTTPIIVKEILSSLHKLGMPNAELSFEILESENFNEFGKDEINLLFSANKGIPLKAINKSVSGGERSRLMLAIKESVAKHKDLPTLILDEIDTGVSGKIAGSMGEIMAEAGKHIQVIAISHLPQVAAYGQQHLKVKKQDIAGVTQSSVQVLNEEERIQELAQMLSGKEVSEAAIQQAKELINKK